MAVCWLQTETVGRVCVCVDLTEEALVSRGFIRDVTRLVLALGVSNGYVRVNGMS